MTALPTRDHLARVTTPAPSWLQHNTALGQLYDVVSELLGGSGETELTLSADAVTPTSGAHRIDTQADAAADDLKTIVQTNIPEGRLLLLTQADPGRVVTVRHGVGGAGQILLDGGQPFVLGARRLLLRREGTLWREVARLGGTAGGGLDVGTAAGCLVQLDALGRLPAVNASQLTGLPAPPPSFPTGGIVMWSGTIASIPAGWALCDGQGGRPDLRDRFIMGAGASVQPGATGGSAQTSSAGAHGHAGSSTGFTTLSSFEMPAHAHGFGFIAKIGTGNPNNNGNLGSFVDGDDGGAIQGQSQSVNLTQTGSQGGGGSHNHSLSLSADGAHAHTATPPFYALAFIIKL